MFCSMARRTTIFGGIRSGGGMGMIIFGTGTSIYPVSLTRPLGLCLTPIYFDLHLHGVTGRMWTRNTMVAYSVLFFTPRYRLFVSL